MGLMVMMSMMLTEEKQFVLFEMLSLARLSVDEITLKGHARSSVKAATHTSETSFQPRLRTQKSRELVAN